MELTEVGVLHGLPGGEAGVVVVTQQLVQEVQSLGAHQVLVLTVHKPLPPLTGVSGEWTRRERSIHKINSTFIQRIDSQSSLNTLLQRLFGEKETTKNEQVI